MAASEQLPEFRLERVFDAPIEDMWAAWTEPGRLEKWFGPKGCKAESVSFDLRPGGVSLTRISMPGQPTLYARFAYREIEAPRKLSWLHAVADAQGRITKHPMGQALPAQMLATAAFDSQGQATRLILTKTPFEASAEEVEAFRQALQGMQWGWSGNLDVLEDYLKAR